MPVNPKKLAAFANQKKPPGKPGMPFGKRGGMKGKGFPPPPNSTPQEIEEDDEGEEGGMYGKGVDAEAIGQRVQSGNGDQKLMQMASGITEETNPPDTITDEALWEKAKKAVEPKWDDYDEPYAVVMHVYKEMGGGFKGGGDDVEGDDEDEDYDEMDDGGGGA